VSSLEKVGDDIAGLEAVFDQECIKLLRRHTIRNCVDIEDRV